MTVPAGAASAASGAATNTTSARMSAALTFTARLPGGGWDAGTLGRQAGSVKALSPVPLPPPTAPG